MNDIDYFDRYWQAVERLTSCDPARKSSAILLGRPNPAPVDGVTLVRELWASMGGERWANPVSVSAGNWVWRSSLPAHKTTSPEVTLERAVVAVGGHQDWTFQMSTASGLHGRASGLRRAVDLVHRRGDGHYEFIELKVDSDNPMYAAYEILSYGLAYLHARLNGKRGVGIHDVMTAKAIDLVALGPSDWYMHTRRGGAGIEFELRELTSMIANGIAGLVESVGSAGQLRMGFRFDKFEQGADTLPTAADIVRRF